ncbi:sarcospan isoform X1 [Podarcis lilfordi]|uniref:Sarcospan isoform X1 n=1 Tax=Podarcis lilfordi TaxID=74358 RepID=A0AA35KX84_9SAUR|nr:sarcospan isoform X1 [Podarcis lilfordi]
MGKEETAAPRQAGPEGGGERGGAARQAKESRGDPRPCCGCRFPLLAALGQLALGAAVAVLGFLMAGVSSSLLVRDTPYWAGLLVCVVALLGLVMLCVSYQPDEKTCIQFAIKVAYFLLSALSLIVCVLAVAFAAYCYSQITQFTCETITEACQCKLETVDPLSRTFMYKNVSDCTDITNTFNLYLLIQIVLNLLAAIVGFTVCFVMWKDRYQVFYVGIWLQSLTTTEVQQQKV